VPSVTALMPWAGAKLRKVFSWLAIADGFGDELVLGCLVVIMRVLMLVRDASGGRQAYAREEGGYRSISVLRLVI
jgi:hypothetical protein